MRYLLIIICLCILVTNNVLSSSFSNHSDIDVEINDSASVDTIYNRYVVIKPLSGDEILLKYRQELNSDTAAHRQFIESIYGQALNSLYVIGLAALALFTFLGFKTVKDVKATVHELFKEHVERNLKESLDKLTPKINENIERHTNEYLSKITSRLASVENDVAYQLRVNLDQERIIRELELESKTSHLENYRISRSFTRLKYNDESGESLAYKKEQNIVGTSEQEVKFVRETIMIGSDGMIEVNNVSSAASVSKTADYKCDILFNINPPLKQGGSTFVKLIECTLKNSFMGKKEWWEIAQLYKCDKETFELIYPKTKGKAKITIEQCIPKETRYVEVECASEDKIDADNWIHTVQLPATDSPMRYRVIWQF